MMTIEKKRSCTDLPCLAVFGIFISVMVFYVWTVAFSEGDPDRLIRGVNHSGMICGKSEGVEHLQYAFWPDLTEFRFKACTDDCNKATETDHVENHITLPSGYEALPGYTSTEYANRYCRPDLSALEGLVDAMDGRAETAERALGDVKTAMPLFGWTFAVAMVVSFLFIFLMKCCVGVLVWAIVLLILLCGYGMGFILYDWSKEEQHTDKESKARLWVGIAFWTATTIFLFVIVFARKRIQIAIEVIKSASRTMADMPFMVLFPIPIIFCLISFFFAWAYAAIFIFSAGETQLNDTPQHFRGKYFASEVSAECFAAITGTDPDPAECADFAAFRVGDEFEVIDYDATIKEAFAPHFFLLLWVVQIFVYFTFLVIAGAVADWYFTPRDEDGDKKRGSGEHELGRLAVTNSCCRTARYHLGSVIFAAAIIATIQFIRAVVNYVERQLNPKGAEPNMIQRVLFRCLDCMLWCLECCLDKINRNALVWVAIYGDAFCPAVCGSFMLIFANLFRVAVITFFSGLVTLLGKILIPLATTGLMALVMLNHDDYEDLSSPFLPLAIIFIISFGVAQLFMTVYDTAIDTIFMCFLIDEVHNKDGGKMMADPELREIVQKYEEESKTLADTKKRTRRAKEPNDETGGGDKAADKDDVELQV